MSSLGDKDVFCYTGCSKCGKSTIEKQGTKFACTRFYSQDASSVPRILLNVVVSDESASLKITTFTDEVELISGMKVVDAYALKNNENNEDYKKKLADLRKKKLLLQIAPGDYLVLKWVVRAVVVPLEGD